MEKQDLAALERERSVAQLQAQLQEELLHAQQRCVQCSAVQCRVKTCAGNGSCCLRLRLSRVVCFRCLRCALFWSGRSFEADIFLFVCCRICHSADRNNVELSCKVCEPASVAVLPFSFLPRSVAVASLSALCSGGQSEADKAAHHLLNLENDDLKQQLRAAQVSALCLRVRSAYVRWWSSLLFRLLVNVQSGRTFVSLSGGERATSADGGPRGGGEEALLAGQRVLSGLAGAGGCAGGGQTALRGCVSLCSYRPLARLRRVCGAAVYKWSGVLCKASNVVCKRSYVILWGVGGLICLSVSPQSEWSSRERPSRGCRRSWPSTSRCPPGRTRTPRGSTRASRR